MSNWNRKSPQFFEPMTCSICGGDQELQKHKFTDEITCVHCVNDELARVSSDEEKEDYYTDYSQNQIYQERNQ